MSAMQNADNAVHEDAGRVLLLAGLRNVDDGQ
jgi:hypothetical protein